ncbi:MAG: glycosyltransferase family 2 protein [Acidimicrobiia bacterium]|nr:glycosyltransferase family 2 protein [Acidimicrobiia bacterium]
MATFLAWFSLGVLVYYVLYQLQLLVLTGLSAVALGRERLATRYGRMEDMLDSDLAPPVSIVVPAYNEEVGIVDSIRSMAMVSYPRFEIVVANDGSTDGTLAALIEAFDLFEVPYPVRSSIDTAPIRRIFVSRQPINLTVVDKENGGRADALNAAVNAARFPYVLATDADVIIDPMALANGMRLIAEDRARTVGVGGNIRPINGCRVTRRNRVDAALPDSMIERYQLLEYVRAFVSSRPAWSMMNALPLVSGAFGIFNRDAVAAVGGYAKGHFGEDLDLTMRVHRHYREAGIDYRIVYSPSAVIWTEVPPTRAILRRQRIRWHRGLMTAVRDFKTSIFNPRHGALGMVSWPAMVLFEWLAPIIEFLGYLIVPLAILTGVVDPIDALALFLAALFIGTTNSMLALLLDERYGYFNDPRETLQLLILCFVENLGLRQMTVWWRVRAMFGGKSTKVWGNMERRGVTQLAKAG